MGAPYFLVVVCTTSFQLLRRVDNNGFVICFIAFAMALAISSGNTAAFSRRSYEREVSAFIHIIMRCIAITQYFLQKGAINATASLRPKRHQKRDTEDELNNTWFGRNKEMLDSTTIICWQSFCRHSNSWIEH